MDAEELLKSRMKELADKSYQQSVYCNTGFLSLAEQSLYYSIEREISYAHGNFYGGYDDAERKMLVFGSEDLFGYSAQLPITCLRIEPQAIKYSEQLNHRDYLGAVLNLGIERECIGDILVEETGAYLFCLQNMAQYLCDNLIKIRHTLVTTQITEHAAKEIHPKFKPVEGFLASFRLDAVISLGFGLSRKDSLTFIKNKRVFINGRMVESGGKTVSEGDVISVRGKGKIRFSQIRGQSKKGRHSVLLHQYI